MTRLHQLNRLHYLAHHQDEMLLSIVKGDALLLIEEAVLKVIQNDSVLEQANQLSLAVYVLEKDALAHGVSAENTVYTLITTEQWLQLTTEYDHHMSW